MNAYESGIHGDTEAGGIDVGRIVTAAFPFAIGLVLRTGANPLDIIRWVALVPLVSVVLVVLGVAEETRGVDTAEG